MNVHIRSRNGKVNDRQRAYIEEKLQKLARYGDGIGDITVELARRQQRDAGDIHVVQATLHTAQGTILRAEERNPELFAAVDMIHDTLQRQITRYKDKHYRRGKVRRLDGNIVPGELEQGLSDDTGELDEDAPQIVKTKQFAYKPMYSDEAIEQMELLGHNFFVFTDAQTNQVSVVYRRRDGNYGLIVPEAS
jgi:putative sigma-54 modulation protein